MYSFANKKELQCEFSLSTKDETRVLLARAILFIFSTILGRRDCLDLFALNVSTVECCRTLFLHTQAFALRSQVARTIISSHLCHSYN